MQVIILYTVALFDSYIKAYPVIYFYVILRCSCMQGLVVCFPGKILRALNSHQHEELSYKAVIIPGSYNFALKYQLIQFQSCILAIIRSCARY